MERAERVPPARERVKQGGRLVACVVLGELGGFLERCGDGSCLMERLATAALRIECEPVDEIVQRWEYQREAGFAWSGWRPAARSASSRSVSSP